MRKTTTKKDASIFVEVARTGEEVKKYCLNGERTVKELLKIAGIEVTKGDKIRVMGRVATLETTLKSNDIVTIAGRVEGGHK